MAAAGFQEIEEQQANLSRPTLGADASLRLPHSVAQSKSQGQPMCKGIRRETPPSVRGATKLYCRVHGYREGRISGTSFAFRLLLHRTSINVREYMKVRESIY